MLHAVLIAAALAVAPAVPDPPQTAVAKCFGTMDGAVYHGDPSDRRQMKASVATCEAGIAEINALRPQSPKQGPQKLFLAGRVLERAATLSFMGLDDSATALREVATANLYFRIASGLPNQSESYHEAALANVTLTRLQLQTLRAERMRVAQERKPNRKLTAYHRL